MPDISPEMSLVVLVVAAVAYGVLRRLLRRYLIAPLRKKLFSKKRYIKFWR